MVFTDEFDLECGRKKDIKNDSGVLSEPLSG